MITCLGIFHVWPKTALLLPVWPRDAKRLDIPGTFPLHIFNQELLLGNFSESCFRGVEAGGSQNAVTEGVNGKRGSENCPCGLYLQEVGISPQPHSLDLSLADNFLISRLLPTGRACALCRYAHTQSM